QWARSRSAGEWLASWLNEPTTPQRERISALLLRIEAMLKEANPDPEMGSQVDEMEHANELIDKYGSRPRFITNDGKQWIVEHFPLAEIDHDEWQAARSILRLAENGLIDRIRRCAHCSKKWLFARVPKQIHCSVECQQAHFRSNPGFKAKRRKYALKYYHDWLSPKSAKNRMRKKGKR